MTDQPDEISPTGHVIPELHRLRLDVLLQELGSRANDIIGVEHKLHRLLDAVMTVAGELSLPDTLLRITEVAAELTDAQYAALGVIGPDQEQLVEFINVGMGPDAREKIGDLPRGKGILGLLITHPVPLRLADLREHPASFGFPPNHPPMGTFLGVPIRSRSQIFGNLYLTQKKGGGEFTEQDEDLMVALAAAAGIAIENARLYEETSRRERWLAASSEVTSRMLRGAEVSETTQLVIDKAAEMVAADAAFLLIRDETTDQLTVLAAFGDLALETVGQQYTLTGLTADMLFVGPGMLVPLGSGSRALGVLAVGRGLDGAPFRDTDLAMIEMFAGHAALALEFNQASADRQRLAIYEDRDRIARDLHDLIIQRLFAIGLGVQGLLPKVTQADVVQKLSTYVDDLDETIHDVRRTIFSLQEPEERASGLRGEIVRAVSRAAAILSYEPQLTMGGPLDSVVPDGLRPDLLAVIREALTNVARHSQGRSADVRVVVDTQTRTLTAIIEDDGIGPHPDNPPGHGTVNMAFRAQRLGGSFTLERAPHGGARLTWTVPLDPTD